jgi:glucoamylase
MTVLAPDYKWLDGQGEAPGAPGLEPRWTSAEKDSVGTAYSAASRVWFTVSHGTLNEVYYPTIDRPQIRDMEFLITDGATFLHEEKRDLDKSFEYIDDDALGVRLINRDREGRYTLTKQVICDPHHSVLLTNVKLEGDPEFIRRLRLYALLAPHVSGGGAGNSARLVEIAGKKVLLAWRGGTSIAMAVENGFERASCGFVGTSDGWQDLTQHFRMEWEYGSALDGNIAVMGEIRCDIHTEFTVAIGFGEGHHAAISGAVGSLTTPFGDHLTRFVEQWHRAESPMELAPFSRDGGALLLTSHNVILAHEDKTYSGAFIASASIPWGQVKSDDDLGGYHLVWTRDMVQSATAMMACGRIATARRALVYLACTQKRDGSFAQNFWIDGTPYWTGIQLDEVAFPIMLAWRLWKVDGLGKFDVVPFVERAAAFLVRYAPITQQERWEENSGYSPSTLAAVISGLICAAEITRAHGSFELAQFLEEHADWIESHLEIWTVTNEGTLFPEVPRHFMRIRPPECGAPYAREGCGAETVHIQNRGPGERAEYPAREVVDAGFLELVRYGVRRADDPLIIDSLRVVDHVLKVSTPKGPCWRRYNHDGYGQKHDGGPFEGWGQGRAWPIMTGERAHYELAAGKDVSDYISTLERFASKGGMLPEQIWDAPDLPEARMYLGEPTGAAMPLVWAHAEYLKLLRSVSNGLVYDRIGPVYDRYCQFCNKKSIEIFKLRRRISELPQNSTMRVIAEHRFRLLWSGDSWQTVHTVESRYVGYAGAFADVCPLLQQDETLSFTLYWPDENRWEGRNFDVRVV